MTFLPSFLLAIISTLDLTNKMSLSILINHPYVVLLGTFTFFCNSKLKICGDRRIALSNKLTVVNMLVNVLVPGILFIYESSRLGFQLNDLLFFLRFLLPAVLTLLFLYLEKISCCPCCRSAGRLVRVFDPDQSGKSFIMEGGRVVEVTETEKGGHFEKTGLEDETGDETGETVTNITIEDVEDRRESEEADDEPDLETEKYQVEEVEEKGEADHISDCSEETEGQKP